MSDQKFIDTLTKAHLSELRRIITGLDEEDLSRLNNLIKDPDEFSDHIMQFLPLSVKKLIASNQISLDEIVPFIEQAIQSSIVNNPQKFANILYPIMIPAIRKAVSEDIKRMLDNVTSSVDNSFSIKRLGWRLQSLFSGKSYGEIVMSHAFIFRVRQVFLIHRETGLLLTEVTDDKGGIAHNADMVSSMLTAIKDFAQDSFNVDKSESDLNTIQMGEYTIWIEQGPYAIIAAIIEGRAPEDLKLVLKETIESVHVNFNNELVSFEGDTSVFEKSNRFLKNCIRYQEKEKKKKKPVVSILLLLILLGALGYWIYTTVDTKLRFKQFIEAVKTEPGIMVNKTFSQNGKRVVTGLKDPVANNPYSYSERYGFDTSTLELRFKPFISLEYPIILKRVRKVFGNTPAEVLLQEDTLYVTTAFPKQTADSVKNQLLIIPGINHVKFTNIDKEQKKKEIVIENIFNIEQHYFTFGYNVVKLDSIQKAEFKDLIKEINNVFDFNFKQDSVPVILVIAHTSYSGNAEANKLVAFRRAKQFMGLMIDAGIPMETMVPTVAFIEDNNDEYPIRSVSFKVKYVKPEDL
jgi:OOP family OmpA-OmpF porin